MMFNENLYTPLRPVPVAAWSKEYICGHLPAEIMGWNPTRGMDICLMGVLCDVR